MMVPKEFLGFISFYLLGPGDLQLYIFVWKIETLSFLFRIFSFFFLVSYKCYHFWFVILLLLLFLFVR